MLAVHELLNPLVNTRSLTKLIHRHNKEEKKEKKEEKERKEKEEKEEKGGGEDAL
jgi:hypothetical protein